ncbi:MULTISPECIES: S9 family peptidase [unclassified Granulicatella]|uniref:S9 family peptidase n=1 Tax=unclassified Granulicatella TaxID=2630493 RepID=UPI00066B330E|nr:MULTISPECIES: S9 family peptidase [unclassified Granulicatella]
MKKIEQKDLFELKNVAQPVVAGGDIFFTETKMNEKKNTYETAVYKYTNEGKVAYGDDGTVNSSLQVSPDGKWLSFVSNEGEDKTPQLKVQAVTGGKAITLTQEKKGVSVYVWGKDSQSIYYQTTKADEEEKKDEFPQPIIVEKTTYRFDGGSFLQNKETTQIKQVEVATKEVKTLFETEESIFFRDVLHDGGSLIVDRDLSNIRWTLDSAEACYVDVATGDIHPILEAGTDESYRYILDSKEGVILAYNSGEHGFVTQVDIVFNKEGQPGTEGSILNLTSGLDVEWGDWLVADFQQSVTGVEPQWMDKDSFLVSASVEGKIVLYRLFLDGRNEVLFDKEVHITGAKIISEKELVITYSTTTIPSALAKLDLTTGEITNLYNPNEAYLAEHIVTTPERFTYKGYDNWDIHGWYMPPVEKKDKHAAILYVHGGPQVAYGESFFHEMQALAAKGYGVIMINPRGSNTYGQNFVKSILGDYGNHDFDDLMMGVDYILETHPEVDVDQLYVAGGSYGGFMTNWIVTHTDRFRAAVTQRSISNWISFYGTSDIGPFFVEKQLLDDIHNPQRLWEMSPVAHAKNAKTPLLVLHGQSDLRCPQEQGEQMYMAMRKNNVPTKMILFPQSSHGLSRSGLPNLRQERLKAITDWFDEYSK